MHFVKCKKKDVKKRKGGPAPAKTEFSISGDSGLMKYDKGYYTPVTEPNESYARDI